MPAEFWGSMYLYPVALITHHMPKGIRWVFYCILVWHLFYINSMVNLSFVVGLVIAELTVSGFMDVIR